MVPPFGMTDQNPRLFRARVISIGALEDDIPFFQFIDHIEYRFPLQPLTLPDHHIAGESAFVGETAHVGRDQMRRGGDAPEKPLPFEALRLTNGLKDFLGHITVGGPGDNDQVPGLQGRKDGFMLQHAFGNESLSRSRGKDKRFHQVISFFEPVLSLSRAKPRGKHGVRPKGLIPLFRLNGLDYVFQGVGRQIPHLFVRSVLNGVRHKNGRRIVTEGPGL
jgi:hypothetical protein